MKRRLLADLRHSLVEKASDVVDVTGPTLLGPFHARLGRVAREVKRINAVLSEATGPSRGAFLFYALERLDADLFLTVARGGDLPIDQLAEPDIDAEHARDMVRRRTATLLAEHHEEISRHLTPLWTALRGLTLLERVDFSAIIPLADESITRTPLRVVAQPLQDLHQALELALRSADPSAIELALSFARPRLRSIGSDPDSLWREIRAFTASVPLLDLVRFAKQEPLLAVPSLSIKSDWRPHLHREVIARAVDRVAPSMLEARMGRVRRILSDALMVDDPAPRQIPPALYPRTVEAVLEVAQSEFFHDTRRVVTQLVIDATFHHLDTRNVLHQLSLQLDQAMERMNGLFGSRDTPGTLSEEVARLQHRTASSSLVRRQLVGVYERSRPRIRAAIEEILLSLEEAGSIVARNHDGRDEAYDASHVKARSFSGEYRTSDLLEVVATQWYPLGKALRSLYQIESELSARAMTREAAPHGPAS